MWDAVQDEFERGVEALQRERPNRRLTRRQRLLDAPLNQEQSQPQLPLGQDQAADMAMALSPEDNNARGAVNDVQADAGESWLTERVDITGEILGRSREVALRDAAGSVLEAVRGTPMPTAESTRHMNSPASNRLRDVIDRRNAGRELWEAADRVPPQDNWGGARPRERRQTHATGRGGYMSRAENRLVVSPERAFNPNDAHGRFLAQRLERQARLEAAQGFDGRVDVREIRRRHEEDRAEWRREQDELMAELREMRQQLEEMNLQEQQQPQQRQPRAVQPPPPPPPPQNQLNIPPPQPNPPARLQVPAAPLPPQHMHPQQMIPQPYNPFLLPPPPVINVHPPAVQQPYRVGTPADWDALVPPGVQRQRNLVTPVGARTPRGFTPRRHNLTDDEQWDRQEQYQADRIDKRNLKLKTFKGKDVEEWKSLFEDFAEQFRWTPTEKKLHIKANVDDSIRAMFKGMDPATTAEEMLVRLVNRYGVNMTSTEVENKLLGMERKPGEDLYSLADRVRSLAYRAHFTDLKRNILMRQTFFTALRGNTEMQHFVNRYDNPDHPDINITLDLAIEWERRHGTAVRNERVRQVDAFSDGWSGRATSDTEDEATEPDIINKINYVPVKEMRTDEGRKLARQNNEIVSLLRKQAYTVLDEDKRPASSMRGRSSGRSRGGYNNYSSRSSSDWSRPRRSNSRERRSQPRRDWKPRDKRRSSGDRDRKRSKERFKKRSDGKFDKKKRDSRVHEVHEESLDESETSQASYHSHSETEEDTE